jgi:PAS domain-containing protein
MTLMTPVDIKPEFTLATFKELVAPLINKEKDKLVFETIHERKDKTTHPVEVHLQLIESGKDAVFLAIIQDIAERKKAEEKIKQSENLYRNLFENLLHGFAYFKVIVKNDKVTDLIFLAVNNEQEKILGLKNIAGKKISELIPDGLDFDPTYKEQLTKVALHREKLKFETFLQPLKKWLSIVEDITDRKTAEEKIAKLNNELEQRVKERTAELENANNELEEINDLFVGREARIIELKEELEALKKKAGL